MNWKGKAHGLSSAKQCYFFDLSEHLTAGITKLFGKDLLKCTVVRSGFLLKFSEVEGVESHK